jgi:hypothetical protein
MNTPNDGGPVFPTIKGLQQQVRASGPDYLKAEIEGGMSLRDYFAGQALAGFCANQDCVKKGTDWMRDHAWIAADAMLAARDGKEGA